MNIDLLSESDRDMIIRMIASDGDGIHFFVDTVNGRTIEPGVNIFPSDVGDPFEYIKNSGWVESTSKTAFEALHAAVKKGVAVGTSKSSEAADISMKLPGEENYRLRHFYMLFLRGDDGKIIGIHANIRSYTEKELSEKEIIGIFTSDKAPHIFGQRIVRLMDKYADKNIAFVQFDVERFKLINDMYGVEAGDELLKYFSDSLAAICTDDQPFLRLTADVFMIVTPFDSEEEIVDFIHNLENSLGNEYKNIEFRLVFGVAIAMDKTLHTRRHGDNASLARKSVKGNALNNIGFYNGSLKTELYHRQNIEDDMKSAMINNEFAMYLQPKYSISTGKIIGAEALTRWIHPVKGMISPDEFIPIFEKNGFIVRLDRYIWECACKKLRDWIDNGIAPVPISVNISREYLNSYDVVGTFVQLVDTYQIPVKLLEAEITESVDADDTSDVVRQMKEKGFTMLMDDFGSGFSSLNMLKTTPFDVLKIDRGFLSEFMESERGRKIISHTINMSRDIGLDIIAEGVETKEQAQFLKSCGCDSAQGFFYSKPVSEEDFDRQLAESNGMKPDK